MNHSFTATYIKKIEKIFFSSPSIKKTCNKNYCVIFFNNKNFLIRESNEFDIGKKTFFYNNAYRSMTEHAELRAIKEIKNKKDLKKCHIFSLRISINEENNKVNFSKSVPCLNCYNTLHRLGLLRRVFFMTSSSSSDNKVDFYCFYYNQTDDDSFIIIDVRFSSAERKLYRTTVDLTESIITTKSDKVLGKKEPQIEQYTSLRKP